MPEPIRVLLADDHALIRAGLRAILAAEPDLVLAGDAATGEVVRRLCFATCPDVLLLDLRMPGPPAPETVAWIREHCPATRTVILTAHREDAWVRGLLDPGAAGYVLKDDALEAIPRAVRAVAAGGTWLSPAVLPAVLHLELKAASETLTSREYEVLRLLAAGRSNKELAVTLRVSVRTAEFHVKNVRAKLGARSRAEVLPLAQRHKLLLPISDADSDADGDVC